MKKFVKLAFCIFCSIMCITCTGCFGGPGEGGGIVYNGFSDLANLPLDTEAYPISGTKVAYRPIAYDFDEVFNDYSNAITNNLIDLYGYQKSSSEPNYFLMEGIEYQLVYIDGKYSAKENSAWEWEKLFDFSNTVFEEKGTSLTEEEFLDGLQDMRTQEITAKKYESFISLSAIALESVCYEILLGKQPTIFEQDAFDSPLTLNSNKEKLKKEYKQKITYVGLREDDKQQLINYILNEVIGESVISYDESLAHTDNCKKNYRVEVQNIVNDVVNTAGLSEDVKNIYKPSLISYYRDIPSNGMFASSANEALSHVTSYEFQSILFMFNETVKLENITLIFESAVDINIRCKARYYNAETRTVKEYNNGTILITAGKFDISKSNSMTEFVFGNGITVPAFNNAKTTAITEEKKVDDFYSLKPSENGTGAYAQINENWASDTEKMSSFVEINFDVVKQSNDERAQIFKVGIGILTTK